MRPFPPSRRVIAIKRAPTGDGAAASRLILDCSHPFPTAHGADLSDDDLSRMRLHCHACARAADQVLAFEGLTRLPQRAPRPTVGRRLRLRETRRRLRHAAARALRPTLRSQLGEIVAILRWALGEALR
jgi:hypothetical protein